MITVRFASGLSVTYYQAHHARWSVDGHAPHRLYEGAQRQGLVAAVPADALIEFKRAGAIEIRGHTPDEAAEVTLHEIRSVRGDLLARIKAELRAFDARSLGWKE